MSAPAIARAVPPASASRFTFEMLACTDVIGGSLKATEYATELLTVDPHSQLEDHCLVVASFVDGASVSGTPFMMRFTSCGHDGNGRFCKRGSPEEMVFFGSLYVPRRDMSGKLVRLFGRVVGGPREFPRARPMSYREEART